jgi:hypothetical protein
VTTSSALLRSATYARAPHEILEETVRLGTNARKIAVAVALIAALLLTTVTTASAQASPVMGVHRAGRYYMHHVCPLNAAVHRFYKRIWKGRKTIRIQEVRRRLPAIKHESTRYGHATHKFAAALYNPPAGWPSSVRHTVNRFAANNTNAASILLKMGAAGSAQRWARLNIRLNHVPFGHKAETIRAKLDLPPLGQGC